MRFDTFAAAAAAALLAGCSSDPPGQYQMGAEQAYQKLVAADFTPFRRDRQCGILIHITSEGDDGKSVTWRVTSSGRVMFFFTANLMPVDATHTKIAVDVSKEVKNGREAYDGSQSYARPAVMQPVRPAIDEQIDAILTDRPFEWQNVRRATERPAAPGTFAVTSASGNNSICNVQRAGLEEGTPFSIDDVEENLMD